jgi:hypothetical protein
LWSPWNLCCFRILCNQSPYCEHEPRGNNSSLHGVFDFLLGAAPPPPRLKMQTRVYVQIGHGPFH